MEQTRNKCGKRPTLLADILLHLEQSASELLNRFTKVPSTAVGTPATYMRAWVRSHFSHVQLFATPRAVALQAPLSSGLPCPPPGDLPNPGTEPTSFMSPALADR